MCSGAEQPRDIRSMEMIVYLKLITGSQCPRFRIIVTGIDKRSHGVGVDDYAPVGQIFPFQAKTPMLIGGFKHDAGVVERVRRRLLRGHQFVGRGVCC